MERKLSHLLRPSGIVRQHGDGHVLAHCRRAGYVTTCAYWLQSASRHCCLHLVNRHARHTDAYRVAISCVKHVHKVGRHCCRWIHHGVFLAEVPPDAFATAIQHLNITSQVKLAYPSAYSLVKPVVKFHLAVADVDVRHLCGVNGSHYDACREFVAPDHCLCVWNHKGLQRVYTNVLNVDI